MTAQDANDNVIINGSWVARSSQGVFRYHVSRYHESSLFYEDWRIRVAGSLMHIDGVIDGMETEEGELGST